MLGHMDVQSDAEGRGDGVDMFKEYGRYPVEMDCTASAGRSGARRTLTSRLDHPYHPDVAHIGFTLLGVADDLQQVRKGKRDTGSA